MKPYHFEIKNNINLQIPVSEITVLCEKFNIKKSNIRKKKTDFFTIIKEYFKSNSEYINHKRAILNGLPKRLK